MNYPIANLMMRLEAKANSGFRDGVRMPSIKEITKLLDSYGVSYTMYEVTNVVEYRTKGRNYVNSRHEGKSGYELKVPDISLVMNTSSSYYSYTTWHYARMLFDYLKDRRIVQSL